LAKKKKHVEKPRRAMTKRQLSHFKQHQRRQRFIFGSGILIIVAVLVVIGAGVYFGWYVPEVKPLGETVLKVNDTEYTMDYYVKALKYEIMWLGNFQEEIDMSDVYYWESLLPETIQTREIARLEAMRLGITVSDEEVEAKIEEQMAEADPSFLKEYGDVLRDMVRAEMLQERLLDEYFEQQVPRTAEQRHIMAMFLESQSQADEIRQRLENGEEFGALAAEFSLDSYCKSKEGDLGWNSPDTLPFLISSDVLLDSAFGAEVGVLNTPVYDETKIKRVGYWLVKLEFRDEGAGVAKGRAMLLSSEEEANQVRQRLEDGEDFAALAVEFSQYGEPEEDGGEFEVSEGDMGDAFDGFAFDPEIEPETLSQPIKDQTIATEGGYWLIKIAEIASERPLEEEQRDILKQKALSEWLQGLLDNPDYTLENLIDDEKREWAISHAWEG
jgi:parvulin-like peptidyl-prolyl isomerase